MFGGEKMTDLFSHPERVTDLFDRPIACWGYSGSE
jgi:hypothetical protein